MPSALERLILPCLVAGLLLGAAEAASGQTFTNNQPIAVADATAAGVGRGSLYPSRVSVLAPQIRSTQLQHIEVRLEGLVHPRLADLDVLLVPPAASGRPAVLLLSDTGGNVDLRGYEDTFALPRPYGLLLGDSSNLPAVPVTPVRDAVYRPTDAGPSVEDTFPGVTVPLAGVSTSLGDLIGMDPTGDWSLYVVDDETGATGYVARGWSLALDVGVTISSTGGPLTITSPAAPGMVQTTSTAVNVAGLAPPFGSISLELVGLTHPRPSDLELVLREPGGLECHRVQADAGGSTPVVDFGYIIADMWTAYPQQPFNGPLMTGLVRTNDAFYADGDDDVDLVAGLPCGYQVGLQAPDRADGEWRLYVGDDRPGADGTLASWKLHFGLIPQPTAYARIADKPPLGAARAIDTPTFTLAGTFYHYPSYLPMAAIRWRMHVNDEPGATGAPFYAEGPWVPYAADATTWSLADIPTHWGTGRVWIDVRDVNGSVLTMPDVIKIAGPPQPRYTLSEGATSTFFDTDVTVFNPTDREARADVQFLRDGGAPIEQTLVLAPKGRRRMALKEIAGLESGQISAVVRPTTFTPLVVERTMFWDQRRYGGHAANAVEPARTWYFAEGAQNNFFRTYLLLANPNPVLTRVALEFQIEGNTSGQPFRTGVDVPANARHTVDIGSIPELVGQTFGVRLDAPRDIVAERAMYFGSGARLWEGGHETTGVTQAATEWLLAEGATGSFFETYVLVTNPTATATTVRLDFLLPDGRAITKTYPLPAYGRLSRNVEHEDPALASTSVATHVTSSDTPVVVERAMYWPGLPPDWTEAHDGFGLTTFGTKWGLADGRIGGPLRYATYIMLANPTAETAEVDVLFVRDNGEQFTKHIAVKPNSRETLDAAAELPAQWLIDAAEFSNVITVTTPTPIGVERATYWTSTDGIHWAGGANVQGTRLP